MTKSIVKKLIELAKINPQLEQKLSAANSTEEIIDIGSKFGYHFSEIELIEVMQEMQLSFEQNEEKFSDEELEKVVGGKNNKTVREYYNHKYGNSS